jgi:hypothetical protein
MHFQEFTGCIAHLHHVVWVSFNAAYKPAVSIFRETEFVSGEQLHSIFRVPMQHSTEANYHP